MAYFPLKPQIIEFLQENGWLRQLSKDGQIVRFQMKDRSLDKPVNVYFSEYPANPEAESVELEEALAVIRQFYGVPFAEIQHRSGTLSWGASRIGLHPRDLVTSRVPDRHVMDDTIDMSVASAVISYMKSLVEGAASAEIDATAPSSMTLRRTTKNYVDSCRFGHTFRGSFGFQVECPLHEVIQFDLFGAEKPIGRKISERIALVMEAVESAGNNHDLNPLLKQPKISARICSELADFLEDSGISSVRIGVSFDATASTETLPNGEFELRAGVVPLLREAAVKLDPDPEDLMANVVGRIVELRAAGIPLATDDGNKRIAVIQWDSDEGRRKVRVELLPHQYADAIRAHEAGHHVQARGTLMRKSRTASLYDLIEFKVLD